MKKMQMNKENTQMFIAVAVLLSLSLFNNLPVDINIEPETAIIVDSIDEDVVKDTVSPEVTDEKPKVETMIEEDPTEIPDFLESFNEDDLEEEFGDVQTGIDLLNNPLQ